MRVLLVTAPVSQLNTPYPATAYLTGFLQRLQMDVSQVDASIDLALRLYSRSGLERVHGVVVERIAGLKKKAKIPPSVAFFLDHYQEYLRVVEPTIKFMQGKDPAMAYRIASRSYLPEGPTFERLHQLEAHDAEALDWAFGSLGLVDRAKYLAGLFVEELTEIIAQGIDERFSLGKYGEELAASESDFGPMHAALTGEPSLVGKMISELAAGYSECFKPDVIGISAPFSGNVYGAFQMAQAFKKLNPAVKIILGGGFANTNLRDLAEPRVFDYFDFVALDDGEPAALSVLDVLRGKRNESELVRTYVRKNGVVTWFAGDPKRLISKEEVSARDGAPVFTGLPLDQYLASCEMLSPMGRLWSDSRWNKLMVAHGCYWRKCSFCDIQLDYVADYQSQEPDRVVDQIEDLIRQTGQTGFHFVDEAAPPTVLARMAAELDRRGRSITWWGNVRFDKAFTAKMTELLAKSGCIAVTGGLECASDRLLKLMNKGVTVEQVAQVTRNFTQAGIMVHAYLIYGFPTQTLQETVDALENVRQLFVNGCLQSAFWHRFTLTAHSGVALKPEAFGVKITEPPSKGFARNVLQYREKNGCDHDALGPALEKAVYNYMHGVGLDADVREWFGGKVPKATVPKNYIRNVLES